MLGGGVGWGGRCLGVVGRPWSGMVSMLGDPSQRCWSRVLRHLSFLSSLAVACCVQGPLVRLFTRLENACLSLPAGFLAP